MTIARAAAIGSLIVAIVAVGVLMFGSGGGTEYTIHLQSANQLVKGNEVKVGGLAVGEITDIQLAEDNQADIKVSINEDFAPLHQGTEATVRVTSLPSVANRFIALHPGPNNAPEIPEGGILETDQTTNAVDLDQLFNTLDPPTRKGLQETLQGLAGWYVGQSDNLQDTFKYLGPSLGNFTKVMQELGRDQKTFTDLVVNGARAVSAIAERRDDLSALVQNGNIFARAIAAENESFDRALAAFPDVLQEGASTFRNLRGALDDLNRLTDVSKTQIKGLTPFLRDLTGLVRTLRPAFNDLGLLVNNPGADNDSTDLMRRFPALQRLSATNTKNSVAALKSGQDEVEFLRPYAPEISSWIAHFAQVPAYYDANGHYARVLPIFNAFAFDEGANQLNALSPAERKLAQSFRGSRFCPGGATQPAPDGSNPFTDDGRLTAEDCDPNIRPVGP
ncbi:MAG TPA: MlaD family protein [Solirubrobacterales bacterium]|nr:MlaD family protein [Solirubrobacterales bacterium]